MEDINWSGFVCQLIGGFGFFFFGMRLMSEGLQKLTGNSLCGVFEKLTSNRTVGTLVGFFVTAVTQSSTVTTVMAVGFVNAGLMSLIQAFSVTLGANIGTTITAQLIAFKISGIALPAIGFGVIIRFFSKTHRIQHWGEVLTGFGLLFFGLDLMTQSFMSVSADESFRTNFLVFSFPLAAVFAGAFLTMAVRSSTAAVGITIALSTAGLMDFYTAAALVLGANIGRTLWANIAAIGAGKNARRAALGHFLFNFAGVSCMLIFLPHFIGFVEMITPGDAAFMNADNGTYPCAARHTANVHTLFNVVNAAVFLPFLGFLARICTWIIPGEDPEDVHTVLLDEKLLDIPNAAAFQARKEVQRMSHDTLEMLTLARKALFESGIGIPDQIYDLAGKVDLMEKEIREYLIKLYQAPMAAKTFKSVGDMIEVVNNIGRIGGSSASIAKISENMTVENLSFPGSAKEEITEIFDVAIRFCRYVFEGYNRGKYGIWVDTSDKHLIDQMRNRFKNNQMERLTSGRCSIAVSMPFAEILNKLEKVGDNVFNIAQVLVRKGLD